MIYLERGLNFEEMKIDKENIMKPQELHCCITKEIKPVLGFDEQKDFNTQRELIRSKLIELLGIPHKWVDPKPVIEFEKSNNEEYDEIRFKFESEPDFFVPAHLILPKERKGKLPVVICLQGHSSGMHRSLGRVIYSNDTPGGGGGDRDFANQVIRQGYAAVIMEQRGFGELKGVEKDGGVNCYHMAMQAIMLGRTLLGERCSDVSRLIDALGHFAELDTDKIGIMGNSGGGTTSYYAACTDPRIKICMPSCSFCPYFESIVSIEHCSCNYVPDILKYAEMQDLAILITPRPLVIVSGRYDPIFPLHGVERGFETVKKIYRAVNAEDNCRLVIGEGEHRFYADISWPVFNSLFLS